MGGISDPFKRTQSFSSSMNVLIYCKFVELCASYDDI